MDGLINQTKEAWNNLGEGALSNQNQGHLEVGKTKLELDWWPTTKGASRVQRVSVLCPNQQDLTRQRVRGEKATEKAHSFKLSVFFSFSLEKNKQKCSSLSS